MLNDRVLVIETTDGPSAATLPEALARLCDGSLVAFEGLAAHQRHAWDLFLYQTAAMALARAGDAACANDDAAWARLADPELWRRRLAALAPGQDEGAWALVVEDLTRPSLLQPPIPTGSLRSYSLAGSTPDEIDVLVTAKGHDVKAARAGAAEPRHWLFALVTLQTQQGYSGRGNYGIARMNGGFASRPLMMLTPARGLGACFRSGVRAALMARAQILAGHDVEYRDDGLALLWLKPWETEESLPLTGFDPLFVEVCRRLRLVRDPRGRITAWGRRSDVPRVAVPKERKGNLEDPWTPVSAKDGAALTVGSSGFDYRLMQRILDPQEFRRPVALIAPRADAHDSLWLRAAVLVRGQGKTEGLHERWVVVPKEALRAFGRDDAPETIGRLGKAMIADADAARKALRLALLTFMQGGGDKLDFDDERPHTWLDAFEQRIDAVFLTVLFDRVADGSADNGEAAWRRGLGRVVGDLFADAVRHLTPPQSRRERAHALASLTFKRLMKPIAPSTVEATSDDVEDGPMAARATVAEIASP